MSTCRTALAVFVCVLLCVSVLPASFARADEIVFDNNLEGTYDDGTSWYVVTPSTLLVNESKLIKSVMTSLTMYFTNWNATWYNNVTPMHEYVHFQWWFEGVLLEDDWPPQDLAYPHADYPYVKVIVDDVGLNDFAYSNVFAFNFDHGYGHYTLKVNYTLGNTAGYYLSNSTSAIFTYFNPSTQVAGFEILIFGVVGAMSMLLAFPVGVFFIRRDRWLSGIGSIALMFIIGYGVIVAFVLNGGTF